MSRLTWRGLAVAAAVTAASGDARAQTARLDLIVRGGLVIDGSGTPGFQADIGIRNGRIVRVGDLASGTATRVIDARGRIVAPGFIDLHSHGDDGATPRRGLRDPDPQRRAAPNLVAQGVTTIVVNQDGRSPWPIASQLASLASDGIGPNVIALAGHGTIRGRVMGDGFRRAATDDEISRMRTLVRQAMREGARGLSAGLEYAPGRWSTTDEVVALVEEIALHQGVFVSHERSEGSDPMWYWPSQHGSEAPTLLDAIRETIEVGERTGATVVASHIKVKGAHYWGTSREAIRLIDDARARGVDVWADQYPYATSGSDGGTVLIPAWVWRMPEATAATTRADHVRGVLADPRLAADVRRDVAHELRRRGGPSRVVVFEHPDTTIIGLSVDAVAARWGLDPVEAAIALQLRGYPNRAGGGRLRGFSMSEVDIEAYAARPWVVTASDAGIALPADGPAIHARFYGTFPRKIRRYAMDRGVLSITAAIRSMTGLPARILRLTDRGLVREGMAADLVVVDPDRIRDRATFSAPHAYAEGLDYVLVNGEFVIDEGSLTWARPGQVLTRQRP